MKRVVHLLAVLCACALMTGCATNARYIIKKTKDGCEVDIGSGREFSAGFEVTFWGKTCSFKFKTASATAGGMSAADVVGLVKEGIGIATGLKPATELEIPQ